MRLPRSLVRLAATSVHRVRRLLWFLAGGKGPGVHAVALTPEGHVVLVRLTYVAGWRLPGGGVGRGEDEEAAILRELREEIGLAAHGAVRPVGRGFPSYFLVEDIEYSPRQSLEVEDTRAFDPAALPADVPAIDRRVIAAALASSKPARI
jgi:8-oxo-dGTP pyrophosphatase MutT (NUDIX family)